MKTYFLPFALLLSISLLTISFQGCMREPANNTAQTMPTEQPIADNAQMTTDASSLSNTTTTTTNEAVTEATNATSEQQNNSTPNAEVAAKNKVAGAMTTAANKTKAADKLKAKTKTATTAKAAVSLPEKENTSDNNNTTTTADNTDNTQDTATPEEMSLLSDEPAPERAAAPAATAGGMMSFPEKTHEFGTIPMGGVVSHNFSFTNNGNAPLVIYEATSTCGCTIPEYPKEPILPGQTGSIKVTYDSKGKLGTQNKEVTIRTNSGVYKINMKGMVVPENFMPDKKEEQK